MDIDTENPFIFYYCKACLIDKRIMIASTTAAFSISNIFNLINREITF